jgi:protein phosphatase 2C family protein 2/3
MQGWRISMEDAHTAVLDLIGKDANAGADRLAFFGVFDGHGGDKVALFAGENIHKIIAKQDTFKSGDYTQGLKDGFLATDRAILNDPKYEDEVSGCTACVSLIAGSKLYVANAGDSRGVLGIKGRAKPLSQDHKPQLETEKSRITAAGGFVDFGRVNGNLALSRAIGDFEFKKSAELPPESQIVTALPDVDVHDLTDEDEFLVLACDGKSPDQILEVTTHSHRDLGLPVFSSRRRIRAKGHCRQARSRQDLREHDGQLSRLELGDWGRWL